jgi:DNA-binding MarR family transcriptional regulator
MPVTPDQCARQLLEVAPLIMRAVRAEMRGRRRPDLTVPQFRALAFVGRNQGASLSDVASHIGLTLPSMSTLIDGLVARRLVTRLADPGDRRRVTLALTPRGRTTLQASREATQAHLAERLAALSASERATVMDAMRALHPIFAPGRAAGVDTVG